jgi:hypothetical protein
MNNNITIKHFYKHFNIFGYNVKQVYVYHMRINFYSMHCYIIKNNFVRFKYYNPLFKLKTFKYFIYKIIRVYRIDNL